MALNEFLGKHAISCVSGVTKVLGLDTLFTEQKVSVQARTKLVSPSCRQFRECYQVDQCELLGCGGFGHVYKSRRKTDGKEVAVKLLMKETSDLKLVVNELEVLSHINHPNVLRLDEWFEDDLAVHIVTDLATGGDLNALVKKPDEVVGNAFKQVMQAIEYLHCHVIAHRDLKPENCLFLCGSREVVKVIDFGMAVVRKADDRRENFMQDCVGTPNYMSPEMIARSKGYGVQTDVWSAGVLLYFLFTGVHAFGVKSPADRKELFMNISTRSHNIRALNERGVNAEAEDLISQMLLKDPAKRLQAKEVLGHAWLKTGSFEITKPEPDFCGTFSRTSTRCSAEGPDLFRTCSKTSTSYDSSPEASSHAVASSIMSQTISFEVEMRIELN